MENSREWAEMQAAAQMGDQLRLVDCIKADKHGIAVGYYYYGLFRENTIVAKVSGVIVN